MRIALCSVFRDPIALASAMGAEISGNIEREFCGIATHSGEVLPGDLFVALEGRNEHGILYAKEALARGAAAVLTSRKDVSGEYPALLCEDPVKALGRASAEYRRKREAFLIAISGSAGKTTVKDVLSTVLSRVYSVACTKDNFNSVLGVPLTLLSFEDQAVWVVEMGISHPGEMAELSKMTAPDLALLTNVGNAHVGGFGDCETLLREKLQIAANLQKNGKILLPYSLNRVLPPCNAEQILRFGGDGAYRLERVSNGENGVCGDLICPDRVITNLAWPIAGDIGISILETVGAAGALMGLDDIEIRQGVRDAAKKAPRMAVTEVNGYTFIDDAYNASPEAIVRSLQALHYRAGDRPTVAVLGDMHELGASAAALHREVGKAVAEYGISVLFTYGSNALDIAKGAIAHGMRQECVHSFSQEQRNALACSLRSILPQCAVVLFKASNRMALSSLMEEVIKMQ